MSVAPRTRNSAAIIMVAFASVPVASLAPLMLRA
jgi:hypothetical protein